MYHESFVFFHELRALMEASSKVVAQIGRIHCTSLVCSILPASDVELSDSCGRLNIIGSTVNENDYVIRCAGEHTSSN